MRAVFSGRRLRVLAVAGVVAVAGLGVGASSAAADSSRSDTPAGVTVDGLRVRVAPGTSEDVLGLLYSGDEVSLFPAYTVADGRRWDEVMLTRDSAGGLPGGYVGWVAHDYLSPPTCLSDRFQCDLFGD